MGRVSLLKLTQLDVQRFLNKKGDSGLSPRTVEYLHAIARRALNQAMEWDLISRNVAIFRRPKAERPEIEPLNIGDARKLLDAAEGGPDSALVSVALAVWLRLGEALGLHWRDIDLDAGSLTVRGTLQRVNGKLTLFDPKTARSRRTIGLPNFAADTLRAHRIHQLEERMIAGSAWQEMDFVFTTSIGTPREPRNVTRRFQALLTEAGLPSKRFHDLRHTCASLLLAQGVHPRVVMETLGHSQIGLTMNTYSHVVPELQREAASKMNSLLVREA